MENNLLQQIILWLVGGGGAGIVAYWLLEHVEYLANLQAELKRYTALAISGAVAILAYLAAVGIGYESSPAGWVAWLEALVAVAGLAMGVGQLIHGRLALRGD